MRVVRGIRHLPEIQKIHGPWDHPVLTIGNFDGVHLGHRQIIDAAVGEARARGGVSVAFTFRPHPQVALRPETSPPLLSTYDEKLELLAEAGLDAVIEEPFSREFSTTEPEQFFNEVILRRINAEMVVVGYDFAFGRERQGHLDRLRAFCESSGVALHVVAAQRIEGEVVSSSRIRAHLQAAELDRARALLGRDFFYRGIVSKGDQRGRTIGFPTANLRVDEGKLRLPFGVYATTARVGESPTAYPAVTNIGVRPTFQAAPDSPVPVLVETHLLDQAVDLYGTRLEVRFGRRLREERRFAGVDELRAQIARDVAEARGTAG